LIKRKQRFKAQQEEINDTKKNMWFTILHEIAILFYLVNNDFTNIR